ncbi:MAG: hypothetical protein RL571_1278 [Pseudomonadota bacterium]|jgi:hypothetical protein
MNSFQEVLFSEVKFAPVATRLMCRYAGHL